MENTATNTTNLSATLSRDIIYINTTSGQGAQTNLSITIANNGDTAIELKSVGILLPVAITTKPDSITPKADITLWTFVKSSTVTNQFDASAKSVKVVLNPGETVAFDLERIRLVNTIEPDPVAISVKIKLNNPDPVFIIPVTVTLRPAQSSIDRFSANKALVKVNEAVELSWDCNRISHCIIEPGIGRVNARGSITVSASYTTVYTLWAYGDGILLFAQLTLEVENIEVSFSSNMATKVTLGQKVELGWSCNHYVKNVIISDNKGVIPTELIFTGADARHKSLPNIGPVTDLTTFKLLATSDSVITPNTKFVSRSLPVDNVVDVSVQLVNKNLFPEKDIPLGESLALFWNIKSATAVRISPPIPKDGPSLQKILGHISVIVNDNTTYTLEADGYKDNKPITITKTLTPKIADTRLTFTATPNRTAQWQGSTIVLKWSIDNAATVSILPALPNGPSMQNLDGRVEIILQNDINYALTVTGYVKNKPSTISIPISIKCMKVGIHNFGAVTLPKFNPFDKTKNIVVIWSVDAEVVKLNGIEVPNNGTRQDTWEEQKKVSYTLTIGTKENPDMITRTL